MRGCIDQEVGDLRHSYELGLLTDEEADRFSAHILICDCCFAELQRFETHAGLLLGHELIRNEVASGDRVRGVEPFGARMRRWLWPDAPLLFRPAVALLLIALLVYPAWLGVIDSNSLSPLSEISLLPTRSSTTGTFNVPDGQDAVISFICDGCDVDGSYLIEIFDTDGSLLERIDSFSSFDEYETGRLLLTGQLTEPGRYLLVISDVTKDSLVVNQRYTYRIAR